jgi:hypothetical protein
MLLRLLDIGGTDAMDIQMQKPTMWNAVQGNKTGHLPYLQRANVIRIVGKDETLVSVMLEAIRQGAYVFTDQINRTVIAKKAPPGFKKVHGGLNGGFNLTDLDPEAA